MSNKKDLAPMTFPKVVPEKAVPYYFQSKLEDELLVKYPEWDLARASPSMELVVARRNLYEAEQTLLSKREEAKKKRTEMDTQWNELQEKESSLKQTFIKFNKFVRENQEKRERAEKKVIDEINLQSRRDNEIEALREKFDRMLEDKAEMEQFIKEYRLYEVPRKTYLTSVVKASSDFKSVTDILNRYEALTQAKKELAEKQDRDLDALENARNDMLKLTEEKSLMLMGLNNQVAELQGRYETAMSKALEWETTVTKIKTIAVDKVTEIHSVRVSCWSIYLQMCKRKQIEAELDQEDIEKQLMFIKKTLNELRHIIKIAKKRGEPASVRAEKGSHR